MKFKYDQFLSKELYNQINEIKTFHPEILANELDIRKKPAFRHSKVVFAAADHNARMINEYKRNPIGLSNRHEYISRLTRMLLSPDVDGVEGTPDIIEDLIVLNYLTKRKSNIDFLKDKLIIGTVNRGGLKGAAWEMDDMCTCFTVERLAKMNLDGIKFMLRINPDNMENKNTLRYCAETVNLAEKYKLPIFIEGLYIRMEETGFSMKTDLLSLVKTAGVVSALGCTSVGKWIELPLCDDYKTAVAASTCSFLVVPDEVKSEPIDVVIEYTKEKMTADNVRGILLGRNVMFNDTDPYYLAAAISDVWHQDISPETSYELVCRQQVLDML